MRQTFSKSCSYLGVTNEETESLLQDYGCNVENTKDNEISNHEIRNVQVFQGEKPVKKGKSRLRQQNLTAKPWEQDHLTFKIYITFKHLFFLVLIQYNKTLNFFLSIKYSLMNFVII